MAVIQNGLLDISTRQSVLLDRAASKDIGFSKSLFIPSPGS